MKPLNRLKVGTTTTRTCRTALVTNVAMTLDGMTSGVRIDTDRRSDVRMMSVTTRATTVVTNVDIHPHANVTMVTDVVMTPDDRDVMSRVMTISTMTRDVTMTKNACIDLLRTFENDATDVTSIAFKLETIYLSDSVVCCCCEHYATLIVVKVSNRI